MYFKEGCILLMCSVRIQIYDISNDMTYNVGTSEIKS